MQLLTMRLSHYAIRSRELLSRLNKPESNRCFWAKQSCGEIVGSRVRRLIHVLEAEVPRWEFVI